MTFAKTHAAIALFIALAFSHAGAASVASAVSLFSTGGHTVYHLRPATVERGGGRVIISAAYDGSVLCHTSIVSRYPNRASSGAVIAPPFVNTI
ncbi:MAG: hypothetical protein WCS43_04605 [Verrucomicrobiota bacterium]